MTPYERALLHTLGEMTIRIAKTIGLGETARDIEVALETAKTLAPKRHLDGVRIPGLDRYEVGIVMYFDAEDAAHAIEQFVDAVIGYPDNSEAALKVEAAVNHLVGPNPIEGFS